MTESDALKRYNRRIASLIKEAPRNIRKDLRQELRLKVLIAYQDSGGRINNRIMQAVLTRTAEEFIAKELGFEGLEEPRIEIHPF